MPICAIQNCKKDAEGSWLDQDRMIMTYACKEHFLEYHEMSAKDVDKVVKPELLIFRSRRSK